MDTTELITPPAGERPAFGELVAETAPLVGAIAGYGPPVIFLAGPWLLLALVLSPPFALLLTFVVLLLAALAVVAALTAAIVVAPYLLVRHLRAHGTRDETSYEPAAPLIPIGSARVVS
jgi:hypothetical protein